MYSDTQSYLTLCDSTDCSPRGSSVYEIFPARILQWLAISYSRGSSWPRDWPHISYVSRISRQVFTTSATEEDQLATCPEFQVSFATSGLGWNSQHRVGDQILWAVVKRARCSSAETLGINCERQCAKGEGKAHLPPGKGFSLLTGLGMAPWQSGPTSYNTVVSLHDVSWNSRQHGSVSPCIQVHPAMPQFTFLTSSLPWDVICWN